MTEKRAFVLEAPLGRAIWSLGWPVMLSNELSMLSMGIWYFWLGNLLGQAGIVVDSLFSPFALMVVFAFHSTAVGASSLVSRSVGAADGRGLTIASASTSLSFALSGLVVVVLVPMSSWLAGALAGDLPVTRMMWQFTVAWLLVELPAMAMLNVLFEVVSATGYTKFNLARTILELALIAALAPLLIGPVGIGIAGAPIGTGVGTATLGIVVWISLRRRRTTLGLGESSSGGWRERWSLWKQILAIGVPVQAGRVLMSAAEIVLVRLVMRDGEAHVAGFGLASMLIMFAGSATYGIAEGGAILIGQCLGAGLEQRARRAIRVTLYLAWGCSAVFAALTLADRPLIELFTSDQATVDAAVHTLSRMRWGLLGVATWQVLIGTFSAYRTTARAGGLLVVGELCGLALAFLLPGSRLDAACTAFIVGNALKAVLLLSLLGFGALQSSVPKSD